MTRRAFITLSVAALFGAATEQVVAQDSRTVDLALPRALAGDDAVELQVTTGPLRRGTRVVVRSAADEILGAITASPEPGGPTPDTATIPIPPSAITDGHVRLKLQLLEPRGEPRAPLADEVRRLDLFIVPHGN